MELLQKLTEFAILIEHCKSEDFAKAAAESLHKAMEGLRALSVIMMEAAVFWKKMQKHCKHRSDDELKDRVKTAKKKIGSQ